MPGRTYSARVMSFRQGVYGNRDKVTAGCQVLLLRLSDDMSATAIVSVPRSRLASELGVPPPRITEWVKQAKDAGFLSTVRRGRPGVTAVYQGLLVRPGVPSQRYAQPDQAEVRPGVPQIGTQRYAQHPPQEGNETARREPPEWLESDDAGSDERSAS